MGKMELEVKVLNINEDEIIQKIEELGGTFIEKSTQYLYTYDLPTIYGRYIDILAQLNNPESEMKKEVAFSKLELLFDEIDNLLTQENKLELQDIIKVNNFKNLLQKENIIEILNKKELIDFLGKFHNNSKKWIRLRKTNKKTTLTVKHILEDNGTNIQQMMETEMIVPSMEAANEFLKALGFSYKSYQEKRRISYILNKHEIDIDTWPGLSTYMEIEGESEEDIEEVLGLLGYCIKDTISCTVDEIYKKIGIDILNIRELKF
ncbi:MAG: CYTH domain-containing protein [Clostridia bacterium]|nr:CYTH domain-containing protein [Clostridia bacterium]